jgi:hypothetical protein
MRQSIQRPHSVPRGGLRVRLLLTHLLVVGVGTLFGATLAIAPALFERTMGGMMGGTTPRTAPKILAAALTDQVWSVEELMRYLHYSVPPRCVRCYPLANNGP